MPRGHSGPATPVATPLRAAELYLGRLHNAPLVVIVSQTPTVECKPNGPYLVRGLSDLRIPSGGSLPTQPVVALCRCGGSANKPFCDGMLPLGFMSFLPSGAMP
jgi:Iron-binding zinc finger CDGSH type